MKPENHILVYLVARIIAAALNLTALAIFTRMAGVADYGTYLLIAAWAFTIYGSTTQWIGDSFFARYDDSTGSKSLSAAVSLVLGSYCLAGLLLAGAGLTGILAPAHAFAAFIMVVGLAAYELALQVSRTRLEVVQAARVVIVRSVLIILLGVTALKWTGSAVSLPIAIGVAYFSSAIPVIVRYWKEITHNAEFEAVRDLVNFGWPLMLAFSVAAVAQNVDRLIVVHLMGTEQLGSYGAMADLLKQSFNVVGEAVAMSLIAIGKRAFVAGDIDRAMAALAEAFRSIWALIVFGSIFIFMMRDVIIFVFLGPELRESANDLIPLLLTASIFLVLQSLYFGQVIYFSNSSRLQLIASGLQICLTATLAFALVPVWGVFGAAGAFVAGQASACLFLAIAGRKHFAMPIPLLDLASICVVGLCVVAAHSLNLTLIDNRAMLMIADLSVLALGTGYVLFRYDLFAVRNMVSSIRGYVS